MSALPDSYKKNVAQLKADLADLKESALESRLQMRLRRLTGCSLGIRRPRIVQSPEQEPAEDFLIRIEEALENDTITEAQQAGIDATDFILTAQRRDDRSPVWVAVEASNEIHAKDIARARATADALHAVFKEGALAVVAGYGINSPNEQRAKAAGVRYLRVPPVETV